MRSSMAYFAGAGTVIGAIAAGLGGGYLFFSIVSPHPEKHGSSEVTRLSGRERKTRAATRPGPRRTWGSGEGAWGFAPAFRAIDERHGRRSIISALSENKKRPPVSPGVSSELLETTRSGPRAEAAERSRRAPSWWAGWTSGGRGRAGGGSFPFSSTFTIRIMLNCDYREVEKDIPFAEMIYTGPVDAYFNYCYGKLPYQSLEFKHETHDVPVFQQAPVVNYPNEQLYTRVTEFKYLTGQEHPKTSIVYEFKSQGDACIRFRAKRTRNFTRATSRSRMQRRTCTLSVGWRRTSITTWIRSWLRR